MKFRHDRVLSEYECFSEVYIVEYRIKDVNDYAGTFNLDGHLRRMSNEAVRSLHLTNMWSNYLWCPNLLGKYSLSWLD